MYVAHTLFVLCSDSDRHPKSKAQVPFLKRFAADWATAEIMRLQLKNRRAYAKRLNLPEDVGNQDEDEDEDEVIGDDISDEEAGPDE